MRFAPLFLATVLLASLAPLSGAAGQDVNIAYQLSTGRGTTSDGAPIYGVTDKPVLFITLTDANGDPFVGPVKIVTSHDNLTGTPVTKSITVSTNAQGKVNVLIPRDVDDRAFIPGGHGIKLLVGLNGEFFTESATFAIDL